MKKIYLVTLMLAFVSFTFAQKTTTGYVKMNKTQITASTKTPTDTLFPASCSTGSPALYNAQGGGYVCGNNGYGDLAKAQAFIVTTGYKVEGCMFRIGAGEIVGTPGSVAVNLYNLDGSGTGTAGTIPGPGTVLSTVTVPCNQIDTGVSIASGLNVCTFPSPVTVTGDYAVGIDFTNIGNDTLGIVSTTDGDAGGTELTWEKWSDGAWHTMLQAWPLDFDMFFFVIADMSSASINDNYFIDGIKLSQNSPNPAASNTVIEYALQNSGNVTLEIFDARGRVVLSYEEGQQNAGLHSILVDTDKLNTGTYYYSLKADNNRLTKRMMITQ